MGTAQTSEAPSQQPNLLKGIRQRSAFNALLRELALDVEIHELSLYFFCCGLPSYTERAERALLASVLLGFRSSVW